MSELKEENKLFTSNIQDLKITTTKQKDPKKVEAGRRLGQMSKKIREQKMRARIEEENKTDREINYNYLIAR